MGLMDTIPDTAHQKSPAKQTSEFIKGIKAQADERLAMLAKERENLIRQLVDIDEAQRTLMHFMQMDVSHIPPIRFKNAEDAAGQD